MLRQLHQELSLCWVEGRSSAFAKGRQNDLKVKGPYTKVFQASSSLLCQVRLHHMPFHNVHDTGGTHAKWDARAVWTIQESTRTRCWGCFSPVCCQQRFLLHVPVSLSTTPTSIQLIRIDKKPCWGRNREFHSTELVAYQQLAYQDNLERTRCPESPGVAFLRVWCLPQHQQAPPRANNSSASEESLKAWDSGGDSSIIHMQKIRKRERTSPGFAKQRF